MRETHYAVSCVSQKFPTFYDKDKHNDFFFFSYVVERVIPIRMQKIEKRPNAAGKPIIQLALFENENDFGKYRYSCFVTDLELPAKIVYDSYRQDSVRFVSWKGGFREQGQGIEIRLLHR